MRKFSRRSLLGLTALGTLGLGAYVWSRRGHAVAASGEVNVYSSRHYPSDEILFQKFTEATGIGVNQIQGKAEELMERVKLEGDQSPCDVFITVDAGNLWRAKEDGLFQPVQSAELSDNVPENLRAADDLWFAFSKRARVIVYDRNRVGTGEIKDYEELADPKWKGRVLIRSSNNIYNQSLVASMIANIGAERTEAWAKGLVENLAREPKGGDIDQIKALMAREGDLAVSNSYYFARMLAEEKDLAEELASLTVLFPNQGNRGTHINVSGAGVAVHAPNRDNAVRLLEYLISPEAQNIFSAANYEYPVRAGVPASPVITAWGEFKEDHLPVEDLGRYNAEAVRIMDRAGWR